MKILVVGGGMAGITYAIAAARKGHLVTLAERNSRLGKKLAMTGNGKCNIGNANVTPGAYNDSALVRKVLAAVPVEQYLRFLDSCGIVTYATDGRLYPLSDSAANVVDCMRYTLAKCGVEQLLDCEVSDVRTVGNGFEAQLCGKTRRFDLVVLACGSGSQAKQPNTAGLLTADCLTRLCPSLTPIRTRNVDPTLNGLRAGCNASLLCDGKLLGVQSGEVLFRDYGLSGIAVFNLSALVARRMVAGQSGNYQLALDVVPHMDEGQLAATVDVRLNAHYDADKLLYGILHNKLAAHVLRRSDSSGAGIARTAKRLTFEVDRLLDYSMSQVTAGGVDERKLNDKLQLPNGVTVVGELLNADGVCGGYNLYFAAASALYAAAKI